MSGPFKDDRHNCDQCDKDYYPDEYTNECDSGDFCERCSGFEALPQDMRLTIEARAKSRQFTRGE